MKKQFTMSVREIIKETIIAFITYMVLSVLACAIAWPVLNWCDKRRKDKEKEKNPSPESFSYVKRAEDVHFTDEEDDDDHPASQEEESVFIYR